jgi:hypothetical protein
MLLRIGPGTAASSETKATLALLRDRLKQARAEVSQQAAKGRPKSVAALNRVKQLQAEFGRLNDLAANGPAAMGVRDARVVADTAIRIRGIAENLGPRVPRGFLSVVQIPGQPAVNVRQSGRLELAQWLSSPHNPLTSRVIVNRVWHHLFGDGLVKTVDNFGVNGDVPSHPELLDHLATRFLRDGWSIKRLVRSIVLTRAYQMSSSASPANLAADPENRLVWRHSPRRLDAEEIRDATLAAAGQLDLSRPHGSPAMNLPVIELTNNGAQAQRLTALALSSRHRSIYLPLLRGLTPNSLGAFDFAEQGMVTGDRDTTTVAPQALYLLNDPFVRSQSRALADRLLEQPKSDDAQRIDLVYHLAFGRPATTAETVRATKFLAAYAADTKEMQLAERAANGQAVAPAGKAVRIKAQKRPIRKVVARLPRPQTAIGPNRNPKPESHSVWETSDPRTAAWISFCQVLFDAAEFRYLK